LRNRRGPPVPDLPVSAIRVTPISLKNTVPTAVLATRDATEDAIVAGPLPAAVVGLATNARVDASSKIQVTVPTRPMAARFTKWLPSLEIWRIEAVTELISYI
jgi:hypothetical protein